MAFATVVGLSIALSSCGVDPGDNVPGGNGAEPAPSNEDDSGDIRAAWWGGDSENSAINAALDGFTEKTGIDVGREAQAWDGYWDRLATQTAAGNAPDLIMQAGSQIPSYSEKGTLLDLNSVPGLDADIIDEGLQSFGKVGDELYGVVAAANAMGLVANDALLEEAGVALPDGEYSWDDLATLATQISENTEEGVWGLQDGGSDLILFILWVRDDGRDYYNDDGSLNATPDDLRDFLQYWEDLRQSGAVPPADITAEGQGDIANSPLATGRSALGFGWTQDYVAHSKLNDDPMSLVMPPYNMENPSLWMNAASLWSISAKSDDVDSTVEAINYLLNDVEAFEHIGGALGLPPSAAARDHLADKGELSEPEKVAAEFMNEANEKSTPLNRLWPDGFAQIRAQLTEWNEAVAFGEITIDEAVNKFFEESAKYE